MTHNHLPYPGRCFTVSVVLSCPSLQVLGHPNPLPNPIGVCVPVYKDR